MGLPCELKRRITSRQTKATDGNSQGRCVRRQTRHLYSYSFRSASSLAPRIVPYQVVAQRAGQGPGPADNDTGSDSCGDRQAFLAAAGLTAGTQPECERTHEMQWQQAQQNLVFALFSIPTAVSLVASISRPAAVGPTNLAGFPPTWKNTAIAAHRGLQLPHQGLLVIFTWQDPATRLASCAITLTTSGST